MFAGDRPAPVTDILPSTVDRVVPRDTARAVLSTPGLLHSWWTRTAPPGANS